MFSHDSSTQDEILLAGENSLVCLCGGRPGQKLDIFALPKILRKGNLIYMIQCNRCHLQYIGETKRRLKDRFNEHRRTTDNPNNKSNPTTAAEHFLSSPNHTAKDMILIPIEKIFSN